MSTSPLAAHLETLLAPQVTAMPAAGLDDFSSLVNLADSWARRHSPQYRWEHLVEYDEDGAPGYWSSLMEGGVDHPVIMFSEQGVTRLVALQKTFIAVLEDEKEAATPDSPLDRILEDLESVCAAFRQAAEAMRRVTPVADTEITRLRSRIEFLEEQAVLCYEGSDPDLAFKAEVVGGLDDRVFRRRDERGVHRRPKT